MKAVSMYVNGHTLHTNPGSAGGGVVLVYEGYTRDDMIAVGVATHHQAELKAVIFGLGILRKSCAVTVFSCNQWLVNCGCGKWSRNTNTDLWELFDTTVKDHTVYFEWIKKGSHELLDRACMLANEAANVSELAE